VHDFETGNFIEVNRSACLMLGFTREKLLKLSIGDISENEPPYTAPNILPAIKKARSGMPQTLEWRGKTKDGRLFWVEISLRRAAFGGRDVILATAREISQRKEAESQLKKMAQFDLLTGLPNRGVRR
jgi:two-component system, cell cycle sensor histidine kinase and response regulator CckA